METFDFWRELKKNWNLIIRYPQIILVTLIPSLLIATSNYLTWQGSLTWVSVFFQEAGSAILLILGVFLSFIALSLVIAIAWDYRYRDVIDLRRAWRIVQKRLPDIVMVSLIMGFIEGFFAIWFMFLGLVFAFLLLFTIPLTVVEGDNPFSAIRNSFHLVSENLGECFTFFIIALFFSPDRLSSILAFRLFRNSRTNIKYCSRSTNSSLCFSFAFLFLFFLNSFLIF